jgi:hypothetical protein
MEEMRMRERVTGERVAKHLETWKVIAAAAATLFLAGASVVSVWASKVDAAAFSKHTDLEDERLRRLEGAEIGHQIRLGNLERGQQWSMGVQYEMAQRIGVHAPAPPVPQAQPDPHPTPQPSP